MRLPESTNERLGGFFSLPLTKVMPRQMQGHIGNSPSSGLDNLFIIGGHSCLAAQHFYRTRLVPHQVLPMSCIRLDAQNRQRLVYIAIAKRLREFEQYFPIASGWPRLVKQAGL